MRRRLPFVFVPTLILVAVLGAAQEKPAPAVDLQLSPLDEAQLEVMSLNKQLRFARAQRADCESTLGPIEAQARGAENERAMDALVKDIESRHNCAVLGCAFDRATGKLMRKPEEKPK